MIVREAANMEVGVLDAIIDLPDKDQLTPLYMLCERGYRREGDGGDDDSDMENETDVGVAKMNSLGMKREVSQDGTMDLIDEELKGTTISIQDLYEEMLEKEKTDGLKYYPPKKKPNPNQEESEPPKEMPLLIDRECTTPSRNQLVDLFIEFGANPNL